MPISLGFSKWGCPKGGDAHITVKEASLCHKLGRADKKARGARDIFSVIFVLFL